MGLLLDCIRTQGGNVVTAEAAAENTASCALLERCGFTVDREAEFRKYNMDVVFRSLVYRRVLAAV